MRKINIPFIIESKGLEVEEVANQLFPKNKHSRLALNRVIAGDSSLNEEQISKLALLAGVPISALFSGDEWKASYSDNIHTFTNSDYRAELDTTTWITRLFHNNSMIHEQVIHSKNITLSDYLELLNSEINKINTNAKVKD